ncbi:flagellin [Devosia sp. 2618]|uniref:flagellin N-terminal helical domain-containing protein n=1 Tax=Devosia sp. 2618 TaxID=3156454 RepID=UPI0033949369
MADITLSKSVRSNLLNLQQTASLMGKTQERLATGNKVNSALDNPTNFFTAASLKSRSSDLNLLMDSVGNAVQTIAAADKGISAITKLVESAQSTARQALQTAEKVVTTPASAGTAAQPAVAHAPVAGGALGTLATGSFSINGTTITTAASDDITSIIGKINAASGTHGVTASNNGTGITLTSSITGTGNPNGNITLVDTTAGTLATIGHAAGTNTGTAPVAAVPPTAEVSGPNPKRAELVTQYNDLLTQIDQLAKDSGFNGVNLLTGDNLQVIFNEDGSSKLDVTGKNINSAGLGLTAEASTAFDTNAGINATLAKLKAGIETLRTESSKFGSNLSVVQTRQDFTKNMINVLETGAANLTLADTNEEAANLLALQTRQSLSTTSLSMASQADQNVLQLLR